MDMLKRILIYAILIWISMNPAYARTNSSLVAIVCDSVTLEKAGSQIEAYAGAVREDGKRCVILADRWSCPDSIRAVLHGLYMTDHLEGAVLIGDIPVPMIRDAQHLTSAFKMDQKRPWFQSSVPSDRFYDDFDLRFDLLGQDGEHPLLYYYSLRADSPQHIGCDIYSARIKAPEMPGMTKYEAIAGYLEKVVKEKSSPRPIDNIVYFAGHGYNSESIQARIDETVELNDHFKGFGGRISFVNYDRDPFVKERFQALLEDPDIDIALCHHHGAEDTQYLSATPYTGTIGGYIDCLRMSVRTKIRQSDDTTGAKTYYHEKYGIPQAWLQDASDPVTAAADSTVAASMDVVISDTYGRTGGPAFIMHDACFNGSFHLDDYIAGHYIFNPGKTVTVRGNSVNTLQDIWPDELIGLLGKGVCIGNWLKNSLSLENHIIGDPTWHFASQENGIDNAIVFRKGDTRFWKKMLESETGDLKALAIKMLADTGGITAGQLLDIQKTDPEPIVRMEAFYCIRRHHLPVLTEAVIAGLHDDFELLQRLSALTAAKVGDKAILPHLVRLYFDPALSDRVEFHVRSAFSQYSYADIEKQMSEMRTERSFWPAEKSYQAFLKSLLRSETMSNGEFEMLSDDSLTFKQRRLTVSSQRNGCSVKYLDCLLDYLKNGRNDELRLLVAETLGWYEYSAASGKIIEALTPLIEKESDTRIRNEMIKTCNRLEPSV